MAATNESHTNYDFNVFVYGTLKPGQDNYDCFCRDKFSKQVSGYVNGDIYDLPLGFPAMVESTNLVKGYLLQFKDQKSLDEIDILEGYDPGLPAEKNLYYKKRVEVLDENRQPISLAWTYFMLVDRVLELGGKKIAGGEWFKNTSFKADEHLQLVEKIRNK